MSTHDTSDIRGVEMVNGHANNIYIYIYRNVCIALGAVAALIISPYERRYVIMYSGVFVNRPSIFCKIFFKK